MHTGRTENREYTRVLVLVLPPASCLASGQLYNLSGLQFPRMTGTRAVTANTSYGKNRAATLTFILVRLFVGSQGCFCYIYHILLDLSYILNVKDKVFSTITWRIFYCCSWEMYTKVYSVHFLGKTGTALELQVATVLLEVDVSVRTERSKNS